MSEYLAFYQTQRDTLLRERGSIDQGYPASIATTWSLSFEKVRHANLASTELLNFCAFLAPDTISTTMIVQGAQHLPLILQNVVIHPPQYDQTIAPLLAYSLIGRNEHEKLSIHRLVQTILQNTLAEHEQEIWTEQTVAVLNTVFPNLEDYTTWNQCEELVPHILIRSRGMLQNEPVALLLARTIRYLLLRAQPMQAEPLARQVLRIREQILGPEHIEVADALNRLAETCREQNKYAEAEPLYQRALLLAERDSSHELLTATILNNLAICLKMRRKYTEAERYYQRAIEQYTKIYGPDHPRVAEVHANLGIFYSQVLSRSIEAEQSLKEALRIQENGAEQILEPNHPYVAVSLNILANLHFDQQQYGEAEQFYRQSVNIHQLVSGPHSLNVSYPLQGLAYLYLSQERYAEAKILFCRFYTYGNKPEGLIIPLSLIFWITLPLVAPCRVNWSRPSISRREHVVFAPMYLKPWRQYSRSDERKQATIVGAYWDGTIAPTV
ncbi:MAG: tetratricopeptide repeat protein [Ktedonobacteraceae bacterium]|nr:tetratricopeptide repeat protein [Ktedonobacteraceae bacterium]